MIEITWVECVLVGWLVASLAGSIAFCATHYPKAAGRQQAPQSKAKGRAPKRNALDWRYWAVLASLFMAASFFSRSAHAIPSFARQTGVPCSTCHTASFGPNLTPFGRRFKLDGYTMGGSGEGPLTKGIPPVSAMLMGSFTNTQANQPRQPVTGPSSPAFNGNNNFALNEASVFYGGRVYGPMGAFAQFTYDGVENKVAVDNVDLRAAHNADVFGHNVSFGVSLNNSPTVQDLWNTTPVWAFPFATSPIAPSPGAAPLLAEGLAQQVGGGSVYGMIDDLVYLEAGAYGGFSTSAQKNMGAWSQENLLLNGAAPYWRVALQHEWDGQYIQVGTFGMLANAYADRYNRGGGTNQYNDFGVDVTYQYLGDMTHIVEFRGSYIRENQQLNGSWSQGLSSSNSLQLNTLNLNAEYTFEQTYSGTVGFFDIGGSSDALVYADNVGYRPSSQGFTAELDYVPFGKAGSWGGTWANLRVGLQYVGYTKLNGASANAGDNNTFFMNGWLAF